MDVLENKLSQAVQRLANVLKVGFTDLETEVGNLRWERVLVRENPDGSEVYEYTLVMNVRSANGSILPDYIFGRVWFKILDLMSAIEGMIMMYQSMYGSLGSAIPRLNVEGKWDINSAREP